MDYDNEINRLYGETIATQVIIVHLCRALVARDPALKPILVVAFGDAIDELMGGAIKFGREANPDHMLKAIEIVEQIEAAIHGRHEGPQKIV